MEDIPNIDNEEESLLGGMTESEYKNMKKRYIFAR